MHLFAGAGGGILGDILLGHQCVCAVEIEPYCQQVLAARQKDGCLPWFPIFADVKEFDGKPWRGIVDVVSGGFPCQDISVAGRGKGITGERSGLWKEMVRIIGEVRPKFVFVENSPALIVRGLGTVLSDLAKMGFNARWGCFTGRNNGAPIERERVFIAGTNQERREEGMGNIKDGKNEVFKTGDQKCPEFWLQAPPRASGMVNGMAAYMDAVSAIGNGQIPVVAATAWRILTS